jgi:serine/threonine protein kinase
MAYFEEEHDDIIALNAEMTGVALSSGLVQIEDLNRCIRKIDKIKLKGDRPPVLLDLLQYENCITLRQKKALQKAVTRSQQDKEIAKQQIHGYLCLRKIGSGGLGAVFLARQLSMKRLVAVKVLHDKWGKDKEFRSRFLLEARVVGRLSHQNLIQVYDVGKNDSKYFFSMEFVDGPNLERTIQEEGALSASRALSITSQVAQALNYISGFDIVHRDIKPSNIIINQHGAVKLGDFGFLYSKDDEPQQKKGYIVGTPDYISPEQAQGKAVDIRSDIYGLGVCLYQMLTGVLPYKGSSSVVMLKHIMGDRPDAPPKLSHKIPPELNSLIVKMMAQKPEERYQNTKELLNDIKLIEASMLLRKNNKQSHLPNIEKAPSVPDPIIAPQTLDALHYQTKLMFAVCVVLSVVVIIETFFLLMLNTK